MYLCWNNPEMHKKEEKICEDLGDRAGLSRSYGNQALILSDWGRLDEAMEMHKKEEKIKEDLGDRAGLAICWWNMGLIHKDKENKQKTIELWKKSIKITQSIGIHIKGIDENELKKLRENMG